MWTRKCENEQYSASDAHGSAGDTHGLQDGIDAEGHRRSRGDDSYANGIG